MAPPEFGKLQGTYPIPFSHIQTLSSRDHIPDDMVTGIMPSKDGFI